MFDVKLFWQDVATQNEVRLKSYFCEDATICWCDTNEQFTVDEFIRANCEYPGTWSGEVVETIYHEEGLITVTLIREVRENKSFYAVSFFKFENESISELKEYWSFVDEPPLWRQQMKLGKPIQ